MAHARVTHSFDLGAIRVIQTSPAGGVARDMYRRGQNVRSEAVRLAGTDTGRLQASIRVEQVTRDGVVGARVGSNVEHAAVHHEGHGTLVPRRPGGIMVFRPRGGPLVFTRRVRPVEGTEYLRRALPAARG
jgi:hypothetical protein